MDTDEPSGSPDEVDPKGDVPLEVIPLHSSNLLTVLDENGVIHYESPAIERIYGYGQDDLVGEQVADYFHPEDRERVIEAFLTVVHSETNRVESVEYRHEQADGTYKWVESVASADPTPDGNYVVNSRDISGRKQRERELERTNERLETFATVVSHDLRNPLEVANSGVTLAREDCDSPHLETIATAHDRMADLIEDLLAFAYEGESALTLEPVALADAVHRCWESIESTNGSVVVDTDGTVRADRSRLLQLLENLVRNAVEHGSTGNQNPADSGDAVEHGSTSSRPAADDAVEHGSTNPRSQAHDDAVEHGDGDVTVTVAELADDVGFYVADDGPGISEAEREAVFETGHSTKSDGTGLGLTIVREIAEAHDWAIRVTESEQGGARFEITGVEFV